MKAFVLRNEPAILAACRQYKRKASKERELHRNLPTDEEAWHQAKAERNAQAERILMLIETGAMK